MTTEQFSLGQVLSVTTSRLCCDIGAVYDILNHVTGDSLFTHVLPRASRFAAPLILEKYPELSVAGTDEQMAKLDAALAGLPRERAVIMGAVNAWMRQLGLAEHYAVNSHEDAWLSFDAVAELAGMIGEEKVVVAAP